MAHGWDSYLQNFPSASSDSETLTQTSDLNNLESCLQDHDFTDPVASRDSPVSSTNFFLNPSTENSGSDCAYQKYCGEVSWQADGEQVEKHYLPSSGNGDILDFPTPFVPEFEELKQDCELLSAPFLEDYSDVSSCSDAEAGETRASWKFLANNSIQKSEDELVTKPQSSEWDIVNSGKSFTPEGLIPETSETCTEADISNPTNKKAEESSSCRLDCTQDDLGEPEEYQSCTKSNQSSDTVSIVTATASETQEQPKEKLGSSIDNITLEKLMEFSGGMQENNIPMPGTACNELNVLSVQNVNEHNSLPQNIQSICQERQSSSKMPHLDSQGINNSTLMSEVQEKSIYDSKGQCQVKNAETCPVSPNSSNCAGNLLTTLGLNKDKSYSEVPDDIDNLQGLTGPPECLQMEERTYTTISAEPQSGDSAVTTKLVCPDLCVDTADTLKDSLTLTKNLFSFTSSCDQYQDQSPMVLQTNSISKPDVTEIDSSLPDESLPSGKDLDAPTYPSHDVNPGEITTLSSQEEQLSPPKDCGTNNDETRIAPCLPHEKQLGDEFQKEVQSLRLSDDGAEITNSLIPSEKGQSPNQFSVEPKPQSGDENVPFPLGQSQSLNQSDICLLVQSLSNEDTNTSFLSAQHHSIHQNSLAIQQTSSDDETGEETIKSGSQDQQEPGQSDDSQPQRGIEESSKNVNNPYLMDQQTELSHSLNHPLTQSEGKTYEKKVKLPSSVPQPQSLDQLRQQSERPRVGANNGATEVDSTQKPHVPINDLMHPLISSKNMRKRWEPVVICDPLMSAIAVPTLYRCGACQFTSHDSDSLIEHRNNLHVPQSFQFCKVCNLFLVSQNEAEHHVCCKTNKSLQLPSKTTLGVRSRNKHKCKDCNVSFGKYFVYVRHMRTHTGKTPYKCNGCGCYFAQSSALRRHQKIPNRCKRVKRKEKKKRKLSATISSPDTQHKKDIGKDDTDSNLPKCYVKLVDIYATKIKKTLSGTTTETKADKHFKFVQIDPRDTTTPSKELNNKNKEHKCPLCPKTFKYSFNRNRHLRDCAISSVLGGKRKVRGRYCCPLCSRTFSSSSTRGRHIRMSCLKKYTNPLRSKEKTYLNTNVCQNKTIEAEAKSDLDTKTKPQELPQKAQLRGSDQQNKQATPPSAVHQSFKQFKCNECPAVFRHPSSKYRHMKKHRLFRLNGKRYKCLNSAIVQPTESELECISNKDQDYKDNSETFIQAKDPSQFCQYCGEVFGSLEQLENHEYNIHNVRRGYACLECGKKFENSYSLRAHKNTHKRRVQCTVCKKMFSTIGELVQHRSTHTKKGMLQCPDCPLQFMYPVYLLRHLDHHIKKERKPDCKEKSQIISQPSSEEVKQQCVPNVYKCSLCRKVLSNSHFLRRHYLTHIPKSNHCPFCHRKFSSRRYLVRHTMRHTGEKPYSCTDCGKQFYALMYLVNHRSVCLATPPETVSTLDCNTKKRAGYKCSHCPRTLSDKYRLTKHLQGHEKNTLIPCSCGQYYSRRKLRLHKANCHQNQANNGIPKGSSKSKTTIKPQLQCPCCPQTFMYNSLLVRHIVGNHKEHQIYTCVHCGHKYATQALFSQHDGLCERVSNTEATNVINNGSADDISKTMEDAKENRVDSTSEHKCKFCAKTFSKARSLRYHILSHNEVKPYRCKSCNSCFSRYDYLKKHLKYCNGKRRRLEVCIPKITLDDVGRGWQNRFDILAFEKQREMKCDCGSIFSNGMFLNKQKDCIKCGKTSTETKSPSRVEIPTEVAAGSISYAKNIMKHCVKPVINKKNKKNSWTRKRLHTGERPFPCEWCGGRYLRKDHLKRHLETCAKKNWPEKVLCEDCGEFFSSVVIQDHKSKCTVNPSASNIKNSPSKPSVSQSAPEGFSCAYCSSRFLLFAELQEHFLSVHKLETVRPAMPVASLQHHLSTINNINIKEEPIEDKCDNLPHDKKQVNSKLETAQKTQHVCPKCNMTFINKAGLVGHMRAHSTDPPFRCKTCHVGFWNKNFLRNHYRKCNLGLNKVPLRAQIELALDDSVLVFKDSSTATGSGVLQTSFSCKDDAIEPPLSALETKKAESKYQCSECDKTFTDGLLLISHLEDHGREEQQKKCNKCSYCGLVCNNQANLERHMRSHTLNQNFSCPVCSKVFYTSSDLENHKSTHDQSRPYCCRLCNKRFRKRSHIYDHYKKDHPSDAFACHLCDTAYLIKKSLMRHYKDCHREEEPIFSDKPDAADESDKESNGEESDPETAPFFPCHVCGKTFHTSKTLEDHQQCHLGKKPHECEECGKCFYQASHLQQHQRMHLSEYKCQICSRGFMSLFALHNHKHNQTKNRPHRCSKCGISFPGPMQLREHMNTHGEDNFPCDVCSEVFFSKSSRAEHRKTHMALHPPLSFVPEIEKSSLSQSSSEFIKELKYRCGICNERFKDPEQLSEHGCRAANERPYVCSDCNKHFLHSSHLKKHRKTHHSSPASADFQCSICKTSFSSPQHYFSHIKTHMANSAQTNHNADNESKKSSNFKCPICREHFFSAVKLINHFPKHLDTILECKICKMTFPSRKKLEEHKQCHSVVTTEFECSECGQRILGREAFKKHHCSLKRHVDKKSDNMALLPEKPTSPFHKEEEEEDVDVTGDDLHNCPYCSLQFSSKRNLLEHQNKEHQTNKGFRCRICGKTFALRQYLRKHERRHPQLLSQMTKVPVKNFECSYCNIKFAALQDFSLHMRLHTNKQPGQFRCDMCYRSFDILANLKRHQESHVGEVVYECTECDKAFAFPHLLEEHQQTHASSSQ